MESGSRERDKGRKYASGAEKRKKKEKQLEQNKNYQQPTPKFWKFFKFY